LDALKMGEDARTGAVNREATQVSTDKTRQLASLQSQYLAAPDDATRSKIAATLSALSGDKSSAKDNFMVVGGEQQYNEMGQRMSDTPRVLFDTRTGQPVNGGGQAQKPAGAQQKYKAGEIVVTGDGRRARIDSVDEQGRPVKYTPINGEAK
jgi:hypothetical protein